MSVKDNKKVVESYFAAAAACDVPRIMDLLADDAIWTVPGNWELSGNFVKAQLHKEMEHMNMFEGGLQFEHHSITAEDDRVAALTVVRGKLRDGRSYKNDIFFLFTIADSKIKTVIESVDSHKSRTFWLGK